MWYWLARYQVSFPNKRRKDKSKCLPRVSWVMLQAYSLLLMDTMFCSREPRGKFSQSILPLSISLSSCIQIIFNCARNNCRSGIMWYSLRNICFKINPCIFLWWQLLSVLHMITHAKGQRSILSHFSFMYRQIIWHSFELIYLENN